MTRLVIAHLKCGHTVGPIPRPGLRKDGWYTAVRCEQCRRKCETVRLTWIPNDGNTNAWLWIWSSVRDEDAA